MKTIVIIISFVLIGSPVFSQTEVMIEQIIKLKTYLSWLKKGYDIANKGLTLIGDIKHGDFNLHKDYFNSLEQVNPQIKGDVKIADMISMQVQMLSSYKSYYQQFKASGVFTGKELNYLYQVFTVLLDDVARDITEQKRIEKELIEAKIFAELATAIAEEAQSKAESATRIAEDCRCRREHPQGSLWAEG